MSFSYTFQHKLLKTNVLMQEVEEMREMIANHSNEYAELVIESTLKLIPFRNMFTYKYSFHKIGGKDALVYKIENRMNRYFISDCKYIVVIATDKIHYFTVELSQGGELAICEERENAHLLYKFIPDVPLPEVIPHLEKIFEKM